MLRQSLRIRMSCKFCLTYSRRSFQGEGLATEKAPSPLCLHFMLCTSNNVWFADLRQWAMGKGVGAGELRQVRWGVCVHHHKLQ